MTIATGPDTADVVLDIDGDEGVLLAVMTNLTLDVFGFVSLDGSLAFKKATGSFTVTDASTHTSTSLNNVSYLEVGGHVNSAFAGVGSIGFALTGVDFGILMVGGHQGHRSDHRRRELHGVEGRCGERRSRRDRRPDRIK